METIEQVFSRFLAEQEGRLKPRTYNRHLNVIQLFSIYLNNYAYQYLLAEKHDYFMTEYTVGSHEFCQMFRIDDISGSMIDDFFDYFLIRKVASSKSLMKNAGTVMHKLFGWLRDNSFLGESEHSLFEEKIQAAKDGVLALEKFTALLQAEVDQHHFLEYEDYAEGMFFIGRTGLNMLLLEDAETLADPPLPVVVGNKLSGAAKVGWGMYLKLGKKDGQWYIVGSGPVYP